MAIVQVWLPLPSFKDSLRTLSNDHLRKQRVDVIRLMDAFHEVQESELPKEYRARVYPTDAIYRMWQGYEMQLCEYGLQACEEWKNRVHSNDSHEPDFYKMISDHLDWATGEDSDMGKPNWFGDVDVHLSHQAALTRLDPDHYRKFFRVDESLQLVWPVSRYAK